MDMHTHAHVQVCTHLSAPEHKHRQIRVHTYLHTHTCKQLCTQPFAFPCVHSTQKYTYAHLCTSTGVQTCTYPQVQSPISTHTHKHAHTHTSTHTSHAHTQSYTCTHMQAYTAYICRHRCGQAHVHHTDVHQQRLGTVGSWRPQHPSSWGPFWAGGGQVASRGVQGWEHAQLHAFYHHLPE